MGAQVNLSKRPRRGTPVAGVVDDGVGDAVGDDVDVVIDVVVVVGAAFGVSRPVSRGTNARLSADCCHPGYLKPARSQGGGCEDAVAAGRRRSPTTCRRLDRVSLISLSGSPICSCDINRTWTPYKSLTCLIQLLIHLGKCHNTSY